MSGQRMFGRIAGMMSNAYTTVTNFGAKLNRFFRSTSNGITELRTYVKTQSSAKLHVANKRCKLTPAEDVGATWLHEEAALHQLVNDGELLVTTLRLICNIIAADTSRSMMNERLRPLRRVLCGNAADLDLLNRGERDLCDAWFAHVENCDKVLSSLYNIAFFFSNKKEHLAVPSAVDYHLDDEKKEKINFAWTFLSAPALPTISNDFLQMMAPPPSVAFPTDLVERVVLDLQAVLHSIPVPSFVVSERYHALVRQLFPRQPRIELDRHFLPPGSYPLDDEQPTRQESEDDSPSITIAAPATPPPRLPSPPPIIAETCTNKTARLRADHLESRISGITRQEFRSEFYRESNAHLAIQSTYISDFQTREPSKPTEQQPPKTILKNRTKHSSRCTPKRLKMTRLPKVVRFTEATLSPQPRTHRGLDVPRLIQRDEERAIDSDVFGPSLWGQPRPRSPSNPNIFMVPDTLPDELPVWPELTHRKNSSCDICDEVGEKAYGEVDASARIKEMLQLPPPEGFTDHPIEKILETLIEKKLVDDSLRAAERARLAEQEAKEKNEAAAKQRAADEQKRREQEESLAESGGLRMPRTPLISDVSADWMTAVESTLKAGPSRTLAKTGEGSDLRRHDFESILGEEQWLNDEIINGSLVWVDRAINEAAGVTDVRTQTRKCLAFNSFFFKDLLSKGPAGTERKLRRCGVNKNNLLDVETILLPICDNSHWTILVVRPKQRSVMHMDSLNPHGSRRFTTLALEWLKNVLQEKFVDSEWKTVKIDAPSQSNGFDCGVFTITNAICLALGLSPVHSYTANDMRKQRIRIACMLINGGFNGEFDLGAH